MSEEKKPTATLRPGTFSAQKNAPAQAAEKTAEKKTAAGKTAVKKTEEVKEEKKEEKKVAQTHKATAKTAETKTAAAKKPAAKKAPAKKPAEKKPEALKAEVILQHNGNEYTTDRLVKSAQDVWQFDLGRDLADFKSVTLYVKPEEGKVYGVVNGTDELSFNI